MTSVASLSSNTWMDKQRGAAEVGDEMSEQRFSVELQVNPVLMLFLKLRLSSLQ